MRCPKCNSTNPDTSRFCGNCAAPLGGRGLFPESLTKTLATPLPAVSKGSLVAGKYRILEEIGHGGTGVVYKAEDLKLKRLVALKFLPVHMRDVPELKERFLVEARAAAALDHANICTVYEAEEAEGVPYIAMAFIEGQSLREKILKKPLEIDEAVDLSCQVAEGLEAAHRKGIIHRDIKSANIMVTDEGQAKIMDFGLAKIAGEALITKEAKTLGTVAYMSPEQARGGTVDARTDIWSLGVVLYEMLSGRLPFRGEHETAILYAIMHQDPAHLGEAGTALPSSLDKIIRRALEKDPDRRHASAAEMRHDLKRFYGLRQAQAAPPRGIRKLMRLAHNPLLGVPALIALLAVIFFGYRFINHRAMVRWAGNDALQEIRRLIEKRQLEWTMDTLYDLNLAIYRLAEKVEKYIPQDPGLAKIWPQIAAEYSIETIPPGAQVFAKPYNKPDRNWELVGTSPIKDARLPGSLFRWKIEKDGYDTVFAVDIRDKKFSRTLDPVGTLPPGMVRVIGRETGEEIGRMDDFFIDKYEVTNRQFRDFVDAGGYQKKDYWKHAFIKDGRKISWEQAMAEFVDSTGRPGPATWQAGDYPAGQDNFPVSGVSWYEAAAYAEFVGKSLPTVIHWYMAAGLDLQYVASSYFPTNIIPLSNFGSDGPKPVGSHEGISPFGVYDMAGNVREWCWNESDKGRYMRGGAWNDVTYQFENRSQAPAFDRSAKNGFRCVRNADEAKALKAAYDPIPLGEERDFAKEEPVSDQIFAVYRNQFIYDKKDLDAKIESRDESAKDFIVEKVTFTAAYGAERVIAYLFLPKKGNPPYQAVIFYPGNPANVYTNNSKDLVGVGVFSFLMKNGRAGVYPIYKGTYERNTEGCNNAVCAPAEEHQNTYTDYLVKWVKDVSRTIDYLESRPDFEKTKVAFFGWSWGGRLGPVITAIETRLKASILYLGGLIDAFQRPEAHEFNYASRVRVPTLMLNGKYDMVFPLELTVEPMFKQLGTPGKMLRVYETDHYVPYNDLVKETLAWLDKYLGPANRQDP